MADDYQNETGTILAGRAARSLSVLPGPRKTQFHRRPLYIVNNVRVRDKDRAANPVYKTVMIVSGVLTLVFAFLAVIMFVNYRSKNFCDKYTPKKKKGKKDKKGKTESSKTKSGTTGTELIQWTSLAVRLAPDFRAYIDARFARILHSECKGNPGNLSQHTYIPLKYFQRSFEIPSNPLGVAFPLLHKLALFGPRRYEHLDVTDSVRMVTWNDLRSAGCCGS
ncbi:hypothetical protein Y032_0411g967 [Ancylostoma ceylanicum]|uniref:Uncharacterized protein n=1 Tax=Ancylostoma ceylanicum TaxID=53326 RepID=A0A016X2A2_9BILA|nr:hypothetical protein Y032_0411g967 [Ancylostoma ceylanicum]